MNKTLGARPRSDLLGATLSDAFRQQGFASAELVTRWTEIAGELASLLGVEARLKLVVSDQVALKASRPVYSALSVDKLAAAGFQMPEWRDALRRWLAMRATPHAEASAQP